MTQHTAHRRAGRPRAASRELLEEAACELFLEQGFGATSVADIARRAGVSRSTFFNYFDTKSDLLWAAFDDRLDLLEAALRPAGTEPAALAAALRAFASELPAENVALAYSQGAVMGLGPELQLAAVRRLSDVSTVLARHLVARGVPELRAETVATACAGALLAAVKAWSIAGAGRVALVEPLDDALEALWGPAAS